MRMPSKSTKARCAWQPQSLAALSGLIPLYERTGRLREAAYASEMHKKLSASAQQKQQ